jgi:hypothetical protein
MVNLPIQLPEYWIKPYVFFVYSNGQEKPGQNWQQYECEEDLEPSVENARMILSRVPEQFRDSVTYVCFQREQPIQKVRYGQGELAEDGRVYVSLVEFSIAQTHIWLREPRYSYGELLEKPVKKSGTTRLRDMERVYIK